MIIEGVTLNQLRVPRMTYLSALGGSNQSVAADNSRRGLLITAADPNAADLTSWTIAAKRAVPQGGPVINVAIGVINQNSPVYYLDVATHGQLVQELITFIPNPAGNDAICWEFYFQN